MSAPVQSPTLFRGIVKQVLSGDTIIVRGQPKGGPPPERTVCLSNIQAPRLARRSNPNFPDSVETKDEPYAWEAREFLRKRLVGKEVCFTVEYKTPGTGREYGCVYNGKDTEAENMTEKLIEAGLVEVRRQGLRLDADGQNAMVQLEDGAKAAGIGRWGPNPENHIRDITWNLESPRNFVDSHHQKPIDAVIEHIRDACTIRAFLLPSFHHVTIMMSGIKSPMFKMTDGEQAADEFAEEARYFSETRLLQRDIQIVLEGVSNQFILGSVIHPNGNIQELLLKEGYARCVDWSIGVVTQGIEKLRAAEKGAKEAKIKIWKDYKPSESTINIKERNYTAKVCEIVNGDSMIVKVGEKGDYRKIFLASIRPPRAVQAGEVPEGTAPPPREARIRARPLYDVPYMFEAREFLRKKLIGKRVNVQVDYVQPENQGFPAKTCCSVSSAGIDIGEAIVSKGFATVIRYRQDDDMRCSHYDELLAAETRAIKKGVGLHSKKDHPTLRVADISGDVPKAKQFMPFLQRAGRMEGLVEFVASGSRIRLYIPRETCLVTFLLSGISCPRGSRPAPGGKGEEIPGEPYGTEAHMFTKEMIMQREVEVEVEAMDKGGNFIGYLYVDGVNLSVALVEEGLSTVHFTAERSSHYNTFLGAQERAKTVKKNYWSTFVEPKEEVSIENEPEEREVTYKNVVITEVASDGHFYGQDVETGPQLEKLMDQMRAEMTSNPPLPGAFTAKKGELCAAKFVDGEWYRARVEKIDKNKISLLYVDFGNRETTTSVSLAVLPAAYQSLPVQAISYQLACAKLPTDEDGIADAVDAIEHDILNKQVLLNTEYKNGGISAVTLQYADTKEDVATSLITEGLLLVDIRKEKRLKKLVNTYTQAQEKAKQSRANIWRYGDITEDDAKEFGM